jgi:hypothetical protein
VEIQNQGRERDPVLQASKIVYPLLDDNNEQDFLFSHSFYSRGGTYKAQHWNYQGLIFLAPLLKTKARMEVCRLLLSVCKLLEPLPSNVQELAEY